jgi:heme/copper-type cytochrome/quinol oxidase subunit 2
MKNVGFLTVILFTITILILRSFDFFEIFSIGGKTDLLDLFMMIVVIAIIGLVVWVISYIIFDSMSDWKQELVGKTVGKDIEVDSTTTVIPMSTGNTTMLLPISSTSTTYSIFVKTSDGQIYECECSKQEHALSKEGNEVRFVKDVRKSGSVYYYTK